MGVGVPEAGWSGGSFILSLKRFQCLNKNTSLAFSNYCDDSMLQSFHPLDGWTCCLDGHISKGHRMGPVAEWYKNLVLVQMVIESCPPYPTMPLRCHVSDVSRYCGVNIDMVPACSRPFAPREGPMLRLPIGECSAKTSASMPRPATGVAAYRSLKRNAPSSGGLPGYVGAPHRPRPQKLPG